MNAFFGTNGADEAHFAWEGGRIWFVVMQDRFEVCACYFGAGVELGTNSIGVAGCVVALNCGVDRFIGFDKVCFDVVNGMVQRLDVEIAGKFGDIFWCFRKDFVTVDVW